MNILGSGSVGLSDLRENYRQAGFGKKLGFGGRPALILVDFVEGYFAESSPLYTPEACAVMKAALASALRVRAAARAAGIPVIITKVELSPAQLAHNLMLGWTAGSGLFEEGEALAQLAAGLDPQEDEIVLNKHYASSFFATPLATILATLRADSLIITGLSTSGCVRATAVDCVSHGYIPLVVREAVADRDSRPHAASLFDLESKYGDVVSEGEVAAHLHRIRNAAILARHEPRP